MYKSQYETTIVNVSRTMPHAGKTKHTHTQRLCETQQGFEPYKIIFMFNNTKALKRQI